MTDTKIEINFEYKGTSCIVSYSKNLLEKIPHKYVKLLSEEILRCVNLVDKRKEETQ